MLLRAELLLHRGNANYQRVLHASRGITILVTQMGWAGVLSVDDNMWGKF